jgi:serine/alanine adding enzyme
LNLLNTESITLPKDARWPKLHAHDPLWSRVLTESFGHQSFFLARPSSTAPCAGCLPLSLVKSRLFGRFLVSQPYLNSGGVWTNEESVAQELVDEAVLLADKLDVQYLELRHEVPLSHPKLNYERNDKVHMRLSLPSTSDALMSGFKSKLRSQIKKSSENSFSTHWGGAELIPEFYSVFSVNMRDLGTPVYSIQLFHSILKAFRDRSEICVIRLGTRPVAAAIVVHYEDCSEVPSASSLRSSNPLGANMWMYWQLLQHSIERGSKTFEFGRSSVGSGTYKFKEQWGAKPSPACWQYYVRRGTPEEMRPDSPRKKKLIEVWKKLPIWVTRWIGPHVVRGIP